MINHNTDSLQKSYFEWMVSVLVPDFNKRLEYSKLLETLNRIEFIPSIDMDFNRLKDGTGLRYRFGDENHIYKSTIYNLLDITPCSMLEMMCALSLRIEETIMTDYNIGDRTPLWFEEMLSSLGFLDQNNANFDYNLIMFKINIFNNRQYNRNGNGGLFTIKNQIYDLRELEIWNQMNLYLKEIDCREQQQYYV